MKQTNPPTGLTVDDEEYLKNLENVHKNDEVLYEKSINRMNEFIKGLCFDIKEVRSGLSN